MFHGSRRHLKSFSGNFLVLIFLLRCLLIYLVKSLVLNATILEQTTAKYCPPFLGIPITRNHQKSQLLYAQLIQTGFQEVSLVNSQSVNTIHSRKSYRRHGLPRGYICPHCFQRKYKNKVETMCVEVNSLKK